MPAIQEHFESIPRVIDEEVALLPGMKELRQGGNVVGDALVEEYDDNISCASFTDSSDDDGSDS